MSDNFQGRKRTFHYTTPKTDKADYVFGIQTVLETLQSEKEIDKILIQRELGKTEIQELAEARGIFVQKVPMEKLNRITRKNHQGVIAFTSMVNYAKIDNIIAEKFEQGIDPFILVLDRITDVRNFGAIARTAESAGVHAILIPSKGAAQINGDAMKTSSGALNHLPVCREERFEEAVKNLKESGLKIVSVTEKGNKFYHEETYEGPLAIIMGSEENGISENLQQISDSRVKIPQLGKIESLNVSVATGIILYEAIK